MSRLRFRYTWVNIEGEELDDTKRAPHTFRVLAVEEVTP